MNVIRRREIDQSADGRVYTERVHELRESGQGVTEVVHRTRTARCPVCASAVASHEGLRGRCQRCGRGPMCVICTTRCAACSRDICPRCRESYVWGGSPVTVCQRCQRQLNRRAAIEQRTALGHEGFRRFTARQQMVLRLRELRHRQRMEMLRNFLMPGGYLRRGRRGRYR